MRGSLTTHDRLSEGRWAVIAVTALVLLAVGIGLLIVTNYGESWYEVSDAVYGRASLAAYGGSDSYWTWGIGNTTVRST